ncbi:MAG: hypothetical protein ACQEXN_05610 [Actinomycetota bacterium]
MPALEPGYAPSLRSLLDHLATLTRNGTDEKLPGVPTLAVPTPLQCRAFDLIGQPVPLTLGGE